MGFSQHQSWGKKLVICRRKNWYLQARNRIPTCLDWRWFQRGTGERGHPKPPETQKKLCLFGAGNKLFPGPVGNRAGRSESQGLRFCHQAWQGRREAINDISQDGNNERCCLGPLSVLPPHRSAWPGRRTLLLPFTISPCFLLFPSLPLSLIFALLCLLCLLSFGYFPRHILPFLLALNAFFRLSPLSNSLHFSPFLLWLSAERCEKRLDLSCAFSITLLWLQGQTGSN